MTNDQTASDKTYSSPVWMTKYKRRTALAFQTASWRFKGYLATHPKWYIGLSSFFRAIRPVLILRGFVLVTRHEDVVAVLNRNIDFTLAEFSEERMIAGSFLLNIDWRDQHDRESAVVREEMKAFDPKKIRTIAAKRCKTIIDDAKATGNEIDVAGQLAEHVAVDVIENYFGVRASGGADRAELIESLRDLASALLLLPPRGSPERAKVEHSAKLLSQRVKKLVLSKSKELKAIKTGSLEPKGDDDILTRLVKRVITPGRSADPRWLNEDWVSRMICGLVVFGNATIARTATDTLDELLDRPSVLEEATKIAKNGKDSSSNGDAKSDSQLKPYIYEALRFRPMLPVLFRYCPRPTVIAYGKLRGRRIPGRASIVAPPIAAMFDASVFPQPREFRTDRDLSNYLVFGAGMHKCTGQFVADIELVEIVKAVLELPGLRRSPGDRGQVQYEAGAARTLFLSFDR